MLHQPLPQVVLEARAQRSEMMLLMLALTSLTCVHSLTPCRSKIYCQGELLNTVQTKKIFADDKTFVDLKQKQSPEETLAAFKNLMDSTNSSPSKEEVEKFVQDYFEEGDELEIWNPPDWQEKPVALNVIKDSSLRKWAYKLNALWRDLSRKVNAKVEKNPDRYSLISVPNGFIIPGGRFREYYYWDTYWIVKGILLCDLKSTARGIIENFAYLVNTIGHIPNGGRVYYKARTQPPMMVPMAHEYVKNSNTQEALAFIKQNIDAMDKEFDYWMEERTVTVEKYGRSYTLCRYYAPSSGPRPESYTDDLETAEGKPPGKKTEDLYIDLKSAAESGWDFSARWFIKDKSNSGNLSDINTQYIIPVDLNAFIYWNADILYKFHLTLQNPKKAKYYYDKAQQWLEAVTNVLWNQDIGSWLDYDIYNNVSRNYFYPSNMAPLWTGCYDKETLFIDNIIKYLKENRIDRFPGGIPTSLERTGQQWDFPNAWSPLQAIIVQGLDDTGYPQAQKFAEDLATIWVQSNYKSFEKDGVMYEKYDASSFGTKGGGGEYDVQTGFGWSNGVILEFLCRYGSTLTSGSKKGIYERLKYSKRNHMQHRRR